MMNTLDRYIGKSILGAIFATLLTLVGLSAIIKFVEQFRSVGKGTYDVLQAVAFTVLTVPKDVETFFPMAALLGALIALGNLAGRSELVVMQAAGFSRFNIGMAVMKTALPYRRMGHSANGAIRPRYARSCHFRRFRTFGEKRHMGKRWQ